ncbi:MAG: hypothetical protein ABGY10_02605 [bacterium]
MTKRCTPRLNSKTLILVLLGFAVVYAVIVLLALQTTTFPVPPDVPFLPTGE